MNMRSARAVLAILPFFLAACGGGSSETGGEAADASSGGAADIADSGAFSEMALGSEDATVTVIEYASVTCPHCATFHATVFPEIKENYIDTGKVRFIFREFPTPPANLSFAGSMMARCAADKGGPDAYFLIIKALFANQREWVLGDSPRDELLKIGAQAGMGEEDFNACVNNQELLDFLNKRISEGSEKYDINSTPSFVIDGQRRQFATFDDVSKALDEAIAKAEAEAGE